MPCGPIYTMDQVFSDPQVIHGRMTATLSHPTRGEIRVLSPTATLSRTPGRLERTLAPVGADTDDVLGELGYSSDEITALRGAGVL